MALLGPVLLAACAGPAGPGGAASQDEGRNGIPVAFACPDHITTMAVFQNGTRRRWDWLGADPDNPDVCRIDNTASRAAGEPRRLLFGVWDVLNEHGAAEEHTAFQASLANLMHGRSDAVAATQRGNAGIQINGHYRWVGPETIMVGGRPVEALKMHINYVSAANTRESWREFWFDPKRNLFIQASGSADFPQGTSNWTMIDVRPSGARRE